MKTLACSLLLLLLGTTVQAAVPVEERSEPRSAAMAPPKRVYTSDEAPDPAPVESAGQPASGLAQLFTELQALRGEVQELRGEVERQNYRLKQLEAKQDEQYQDLDRRVAVLSAQGGVRGNTPQVSDDASGSGGKRAITRSTQLSGNIPGNEKDAYDQAFDAMKARNFEASIEQFGVFVQTYPNGQMTPNAFYWLGELHLATSETEQARQSFAQLINLYPEHQKVPDALYKMGVVYHRLGDSKRALEYLSKVRQEHPGSSAAGLAETYAAELE